MDIPDIIVVEELLPEVRRSIARSLHGLEWPQARTASVLGTSQAMVSRYLNEEGSCPRSLERLRDVVSRDLLASILNGGDREIISARFCSIIRSCISDGMMSDRFRERFGHDPPEQCLGNFSGGGPRAMVLEDLASSLSLIKGKDLGPLVPAIKVNIAQAVEEAISKDDVASFPGRLMDRSGTITGALPPEFGASNHLAQILLWAMEGHREIRAATNLAHTHGISHILEGSGGLFVLDRSKEDISEVLTDPSRGELRYLLDPGDFGVEPCLYIFGRNSQDLVLEVLEIMGRMDTLNEVE